MKDRLEPTCKVEMWTDLSMSKQFKRKLLASTDPAYFWNSPEMGNMELWDSQVKILTEFNKTGGNGKRKYSELLFSAGMRGSKTTIAALIGLTELYKLLIMESPQEHYKLLSNQLIQVLAVAPSEKQCLDTIFVGMKNIIRNSPFFMSMNEEIDMVYNRLRFPNNLVLQGLGSNIKTNVGRTVKCFVAEEINSFEDLTNNSGPDDIYNKLMKSTATFAPFDEDIKVAISSRSNNYDFLTRRIEKTRDNIKDYGEDISGGTLVLEMRTSELNPNLTEEVLEKMKKKDEDSYERDFGVTDASNGETFFKPRTVDKYKEMAIKNSIFLNYPKPKTQGLFIPELNLKNLKYDNNARYYMITIDPAAVGDPFGYSLSHLTINDEVIIDGSTIFRPEKGSEINPESVRDLTEKIMNALPITYLIYDIYMYNELRSYVSDRGVECFQHFLNLGDWSEFRDQINNKRFHGDVNDYIQDEISNLILVGGKKVDHPGGGSKDMLDTQCQAATFPFRDNSKIKKREVQQYIGGATGRYGNY